MPRIRSIKPEFWKSEAIAALTMQTRLTFVGLWSYVDDNGVGRDNAQLIAAEIYPLEPNPRATLAHVNKSLDELAGKGRILRYTVDGKPYLWIVNWDEHQKVNKPNNPRYPLPDAADEPLTCTNGDSPETSGDPPESPGIPSAGTGVKGGLGTGVKGLGGVNARGAKPHDGTRIPEPFEITDDMRAWVTAEGITPAQARASTARFVDYWRAKPGKDGRKLDWIATWRNWLRRDHDNANGHKPSTTDQKVTATLALADRLEASEARGIAQ